MKKPKKILTLFPVIIAFGLQLDAQDPVDIDLSDVVVIEDVDAGNSTEAEQPAAVVEIPEPEIEGASIDVEVPVIPTVTEAMPSETEIVLEIPGQEAQEAGEASMESEETISVDFPDEDIRTILLNVADLFDLNLVMPDTLQGRTSLKLRNVSWRQVFEEVLRQVGFTYVEDRNIIRVTSIEELTTEPVDTRVFVVNYARAGEIQGSIAPLIDNAVGGQIRVDVRMNALVITERPSRMNRIQEIIDQLDRPTAQVMIESKFIEVTQDDVRNIGVNWAMLDSYAFTVGDGEGGPITRDWTRSRSSDNSTQESETEGEGFDTTTGVATGDSTSLAKTFSSLAATSRLDTAVFSADQFEVIISALNSNNDIRLVSNPTVVTLDNKQAKIAIGDRFPIPSYSFNSETGQRQLNDIEYIDIGINLDVTPQVNSAGFINLGIIPEVSSLNGTSIVESTEIPIISSRRTETNIMIKDGFTLAIGGLTENQSSDGSTKVPVLGDLPGIGRLFSSESRSEQQRNLIIFITAQTLNPDGSTYRDVIDPRVLDAMGIVPADLPGYDLPFEQKELLDQLETYRVEAQQIEATSEAKARVKRIEYLKQQELEEPASKGN